MSQRKQDVMARVRIIFEKSGLSLEQLGQRMGYSSATARKSAWQFLNKTADPRLSMLQKFSSAMSLSLKDVVK
jgi:transcriptional regulator with XRE-family HTH domain